MQNENSTPPTYIAGLVAVVGCDGTGKSTLTADLAKSMKKYCRTERRYLGLISGEDGDKIKRLPFIGIWLERRLAAKSSHPKYEYALACAVGCPDHVRFFAAPPGKFAQG